MDSSSELCLQKDVDALIATFNSMKEMSIDSAFQDSDHTFVVAGNTTWLKEGLWGYPKYRRDNLAAIQSTALKTIDALTATIKQSHSTDEIDRVRQLLCGIADAYYESGIKGLEKLACFPTEANLWHSSHKLEKLSTCIATFKQTIENALKLAHVYIGAKTADIVGTVPAYLQPGWHSHVEDIASGAKPLQPSPSEPMKRGQPPPPPTKPMKAPTPTSARTARIRMHKATQDWSTLMAELTHAIVSPNLKPLKDRVIAPKPETDAPIKLLETLTNMRRDIGVSGLHDSGHWSD